MLSKKILINQINELLPRLLTQLDRDPLSPTYGCFDRNYWHYKIRDFPSFVLQQNVLTLALLYKNNFKGNFCYHNENIFEYIKASINFWCESQNKSGGFDEYWPNEDGYPPLVFSFYAVTRAYRELDMNDQKVLGHFELSYQRWLRHVETQAKNQEMAGLAAACQYYLITGRKDVKKSLTLRLNSILKTQDPEGWFAEYGGADIGYSSVLLHYLTDIQENLKSQKLKKSIIKLVNFLSYFVHPDGTSGGEYGSRNTEYFLFKGLVSSSVYSDKSAQMIQGLNWSLSNIDDRYLFHYIFYSYVEGAILLLNKHKDLLKIKNQNNKNFKKYFKNSGLYVFKSNNLFFVSNLKKGGVYKFYKNKKIISQDSGYRVPTKTKNKFLTNAWINRETLIIFGKNKEEFSLKTNFYINQFFSPTPLKHIILRIISLFFGSKLIGSLKKVLIFQDKKSQMIFKRKYMFKKNNLTIIDTFDSFFKNSIIYKLVVGAIRFVPSANFFNKSSLPLKIFSKHKIDQKNQLVNSIKF